MAFRMPGDGGGGVAQELRQNSESTMEGFIKHQLMVILQPFVDHVQELDSRLTQVAEQLERTDRGAEGTRTALADTKADVADLRTGLVERTNARVRALNEGLDKCSQDQELQQQSLEGVKGHMQRLQNELEGNSAAVPELRRSLGMLEAQLHALQADMLKAEEHVKSRVGRGMDDLCTEVQGMRSRESKMDADFERLRQEVASRAQQLEETRGQVERGCAHAASLQKSVDDAMAREAQLGARVEGWKLQWGKLNPALESVRKELAAVRQRSEHHDAVVHTLQQGYSTTFNGVEALEVAHRSLRSEVQGLQESHAETRQGLDAARDDISNASKFANSLHNTVDRTNGDLSKAVHKLEGLEARHNTLSGGLEKTTGGLAELAREHRGAVCSVHALHAELAKTNEAVCQARGQAEAAHAGLHGLKGDLGRTNDALQKLDHGVEQIHGGFAGLQKGFVETGTHINSRPITLPKLPRTTDALRSPRAHDSTHGSPMTARRTMGSYPRGPADGGLGAKGGDSLSTTALSSGRSSLCGD